MAKRALNEGEQLSDDWLLEIFSDLPDSDILIDEALDVGDSGALSLQQPPSDPAETHSKRGGNDDAAFRLSEQSSAAVSAALPPDDYTATSLCAHEEDINVSEVIAQELSKMTIGERQVIFEDVNGLTPLNEETPMFLAAKLDDLQVELSLVKEKPAYKAAKQQNSTFVEDNVLRLKFLRCVQYNPLVAAKRFVKFFEVKLELFGLALLTEEITMYDISPGARAILESGRIQKLPIRDSAGRTLIVAMKFDAQAFSTDAVPEFFFYFCMALLEDEATQMSGAVGMHVRHNCSMPLVTRKQKSPFPAAKITGTVPFKFQGYHYLAENDPVLRRLADQIQLSFSKDVRHRFLAHFGSFQQCKERLTNYGIPVSVFPLTDDGEVKMEAHLKWLEQQKVKEAIIIGRRTAVVEENVTVESTSQGIPSRLNKVDTGMASTDADIAVDLTSPVEKSTSANILVIPNDEDVLLGRGRPFQAHAGNRYLKQLIIEWYDKYDAAPRMAKISVSQQVVLLIEERGGRFLKKRDNVWYEVELSEARDKVAHGFRKKREMDAAELSSTPINQASSVSTTEDGPKRIKVRYDDLISGLR